MICRFGIALANSASSGSCGKYIQPSNVRPMRASTRGAELLVGELRLHAVRRGILHLGVWVPCHRVTDAAEAVWACRLECLQHRRDVVTEQEVGMPDN